jgi:hypothetical protein
MLKKTLIASAIAAVSFGSMAGPKVATEVFGSNPGDVVISSGLTGKLEFLGFADIGTGAIGDVTFKLDNGTFASNVLVSDLSATGTGADVTVDSVTDGKIGDSTVTFRVTTKAAISSTGDNMLNFDIKQIKAPALATSGKEVIATASTSPINAVTGGSFPAKSGTTTSIVESLSFVTLTSTVATGTNGQISSEDNTKLVDGTFKPANFDVSTASGVVDNSGNAVTSANFNQQKVTVTGAFNEGDVIKYGDTELTIDVAAGTATATINKELVVGNTDIVYTPKGDENLSPAAFNSTLEVVPSDKDWTTAVKEQQSFTTYDGQDYTAVVYAVPDSDKSDVASIRVSNTSGKVNTLFVQVVDENGTKSATVQLDPLAANETVRFMAKDIEEATGYKWDGRASVVFSAKEDFTVVNMLRTSNGSLTNGSSATKAEAQ